MSVSVSVCTWTHAREYAYVFGCKHPKLPKLEEAKRSAIILRYDITAHLAKTAAHPARHFFQWFSVAHDHTTRSPHAQLKPSEGGAACELNDVSGSRKQMTVSPFGLAVRR